MLWKFAVICVLLIKFTGCARLDASNEDVVIEAIRENKNLVILFSKKGCIQCAYEQALVTLKEELENAFDAKVLKLESSHLQRVYDYHKHETVLVFLRRGVGLLYPTEMPDNPDDIFDFFNDNRDPIVKELDDTNFEHLTQASTGSTTGDWLIQFYDNHCVDCNKLAATWETVGAKLKRRMNVARVNRASKGIQTAKRFKVDQSPEFILLRMGKYYRYNMKNYDVDSFVGFATTWYNKLAAEKIQAQASPFETLVEFFVEQLKAVPSLTMAPTLITDNPVPVLTLFLIAVLVGFFLFRKPKPTEKKTTKKEK